MYRVKKSTSKHNSKHPFPSPHPYFQNSRTPPFQITPESQNCFLSWKAPHNLLSVPELTEAGCSVHFYNWGVNIDSEGETLHWGWKEVPQSRLFQLCITDDGSNWIQPDVTHLEFDTQTGTLYTTVNWSANNVYECQNQQQLIKYYHAALSSHPKRTLAAAAKSGYLQECPGLTAKVISKFLGTDETTKKGHMKQTPSGKQSTTTKFNQDRSPVDILERDAAADDAAAIPEEEPHNRRTKYVYMIIKLADGWIASNQTGPFPRMSNCGNKYISVFYIFDTNFIKGIPIKSRHQTDLLIAYQEVYRWCEARGFKLTLHRMDNKTSKDVEEFIEP